MSRTLPRPVVLALFAFLSACAPGDGAARYPLRGKIDAVDILDRQLTIAHEEVPGYMPAMTMPFRMPEDKGLLARFRGMRLEQLRRGDVVTATLAVKANESWVENVRVVRYEPPPDMPIPIPKEAKLGETVVDVLLEDQDAKPLHLSDYRGHPLALTFIYTRCPLPEFCPRIMKNFQELEGRIETDPDLRKSARLLSVSFDAEFDRPEVLNAFGSAFVKDRGQGPFARWKLATGTKEAIDRLGRYFGLVFFKENGQFVHSMVTVVIGPHGKLAKEFSGNDWTPDEALAAMREAMSLKPRAMSPSSSPPTH
ncbi:MAG: SCO family protein [Vicinamibacteria bacterium]